MKALLALVLLFAALCVAKAAPENQGARERLVIYGPTDFTLGTRRFASIDELRIELETRVKIQPHLSLLISQDPRTQLGLTVMALDACRLAGISDIKVEGPQEPTRAATLPPSTAPSQPQRVAQLEGRVSSLEQKIRDVGDQGLVLFLFGAFCALWAQNTRRSGWLWFFLGLFFSLVAVLVLLAKNSGDIDRRKLTDHLRR